MAGVTLPKLRYDPVECIKRLRRVQFSQEQSEVIAQEIEHLVEDMEAKTAYVETQAATKEDVRDSELRLLKEIEWVRKEIREVELRLSKDIELIRKEAEMSRNELKKEIEILRNELKRDIAELRSELKRDIEDLRSELKKDIEVLRGEVKRDLEVLRGEVKRDLEALRGEVQKDIAELGGEMKVNIEGVYKNMAQMKYDLIQWMVGTGVATIITLAGLMAGMLKYLH